MQRLKCFLGYHHWGPWRLQLGFLDTFFGRNCTHCSTNAPNAVLTHEELAELAELSQHVCYGVQP